MDEDDTDYQRVHKGEYQGGEEFKEKITKASNFASGTNSNQLGHVYKRLGRVKERKNENTTHQTYQISNASEIPY